MKIHSQDDLMLLQRISSLRIDMPIAGQKLAEVVLTDPFESATAAIDVLAKTAGVSTASANRFARQLGFERYSGFRQALFAEVRRILKPEDKLKSGRAAPVTNPGYMAFTEAADNLQSAASVVGGQVFTAVADAVRSAKRVYILGFGTSNAIARLAAHMLEPLVDDLRECATAGGAEDAARRLHAIGPGDLIIAITLPRYSRDTVNLAKAALTRGASVVGITDNLLSPLVAVSTLPVVLPSDDRFHVASSVPAMAFVEALSTALAVQAPDADAKLAAFSEISEGYISE